jgi:hypothetical protein
VLAWPDTLFHNYEALLKLLGIQTTQVELPFLVEAHTQSKSDPPEPAVWDQTSATSFSVAMAPELAKWHRMCEWARKINRFFGCGLFKRRADGAGESLSIYRSNKLNPLNFVSLDRLRRVFGVSDRFWLDVVVCFQALQHRHVFFCIVL